MSNKRRGKSKAERRAGVMTDDTFKDSLHELAENLDSLVDGLTGKMSDAPLDLPPEAPEYWKRARSVYHEPGAPREYPVARDLALFLVERLVDQQFDIAFADRLARPRGEGHAFGFVHRRLLRAPLPIVPVVVNTYYPPNQPRPRRCFQLGVALRKSIEAWRPEARIGILASGGLSHFTVDEALDRRVLDACAAGDGEALAEIPPAKLNSGSSEIRNWIVAAGAAQGLRPLWHEYVPLYRTPAGTGCGMAFLAMAA